MPTYERSACVCCVNRANTRMRSGRNNPLNPISEEEKYVGVNFYQLIVPAPISTEYLFNIHHKAAAVISHSISRPFDEGHVSPKYSLYIEKCGNGTWHQTTGNWCTQGGTAQTGVIAFRILAWWHGSRKGSRRRKKENNTHGSKLVSERQRVCFPPRRSVRAAGAAWRMELLIDSVDVGRASANRRKSRRKNHRGLLFL